MLRHVPIKITKVTRRILIFVKYIIGAASWLNRRISFVRTTEYVDHLVSVVDFDTVIQAYRDLARGFGVIQMRDRLGDRQKPVYVVVEGIRK